MSKHATRSPSGAAGWLECAGWTSDSKGSKYADEGTDAHQLAALCLESGQDPAAFIGQVMDLGHRVDDEMALAVGDYVNYVRSVAESTRGQLLVEQRLPISDITSEDDAHGTSDSVILTDDELIVIDLKYGRGVAVVAEKNPQLEIYAAAALAEFAPVGDFKRVRMVIHQPRIGNVSEWVQTVAEVEDFVESVKTVIEIHDANPDARNPGEKQCRWCAKKATCTELRDYLDSVYEDATVPADTSSRALGLAMAQADLFEGWIKAVRAEVESRLMAGEQVPGFKVVQGKRGNRAWTDKALAEETLKAMRVKHELMYDYSVVSPTTAEKLMKNGDIGPRQWPRVAALITQAEGKPSVAPESDKRPALVLASVANDFEDVSADADLL